MCGEQTGCGVLGDRWGVDQDEIGSLADLVECGGEVEPVEGDVLRRGMSPPR